MILEMIIEGLCQDSMNKNDNNYYHGETEGE